MKTAQATATKELSEKTTEAITEAVKTIDTLIEKLTKIKAAANNIRWRLNSTGGVYQIQKTIGIKHESSGAVGVQLVGIDEIFYPEAMAARYLNVNPEAIAALIDNGAIYALGVEGLNLIPQKALEIYRQQKSA